ncbi:barbed-end actin filament uncapping [Tritrichomonas musculus]|uniref:Barbed-end actin filament uncapping n=1 Tax=Tritrichomonas musculus TaxID=1915356 RepID=A0ABR2H4N1_9EUKA
MKSKNQSSQRRKDNSKFSNTPFSFDSISATGKSNLLSSFPTFEKNILLTEPCIFQFQDTEYENGIIVMTLHFIGFFIMQSKEQFKRIVLFNILSLSNFVLSKENQQNENLYLETSDFQINIISDQIIQISRIIFRNYTLSTISLPKSQRISFQVYDPSILPLFELPFSISQIFQFRYAALCALNEKSYDHSIVQYFHSLMKSQDPIFNLKHIPNSLDRQQILPIFQSLIYIPTIFGISCRNNDTPSIISDISSLIAKSSSIRSIKLMNCNSSSDLDIFAQAISSNKLLPLEELYLNDNEFEDLGPLINSLSNLQSQMKCLSLSDCGLDDSSLELLGNCLLNSQSLQSLNYLGIGGTEFKESSVKNILKYIQTSSQLVNLDLSGSQNFSSILKSIPGSSITDLNLSDCIFDDESVNQLNCVSQFISSLNISGCDLNFYEVSDIISKLGKKQNSLISIKLNGLNFSKDRSFAILRGFLLTDFEKWKSIEMNDTQISSVELFAYQALFLKMNNLEHLAFNSNFKEEDAKCVASLLEIKSLKSISLANCHLSSIIPNIIKSKISIVNLSNNDLNDQDALNLLSAPNLTCVKLNDNSIKNFDKIVQTANENPRLNEPPLKHGLSTIHRITPYSKDFVNVIAKFNVDHHTALNEDLQIPYPFAQKDHEEEVLEIGNPSIYNLDKLNCVTIENDASSQNMKMIDINPEVNLLKNSTRMISRSSVNDSTKSKKNKKSNQSSISRKEKNKNNYSSNNSPDRTKKNNKYDNNYSSEDQYNYDDQEESRNNDFNEYEYGNQYDNDNQYDNNQYENDDQYDIDNQYDENQSERQDENHQETIQKKEKRKEKAEDDDILALMDSSVIEQECKQDNKKPRASYDTSNSESVVQQNFHHDMPPPLEDDFNLTSEESDYTKLPSKPLPNVQSSNLDNKKDINGYSENDEEEEEWSIENSELDESNLKPPKIKFTENSSSTMKSSGSPSPKSNQKYSNNQYDEDPTDESNENQSDLIDLNQEIVKKQKTNQVKSKFDIEYDEKENYNNSINKKRDDFIQDFRRALFTSEGSENEDQNNIPNSNEKSASNQKQKLINKTDNKDEIEIETKNNSSSRMSNSINDHFQASIENNDSQDAAEESEDESLHIIQQIKNANKIISDDIGNDSDEIENDEDDLPHQAKGDKSVKKSSKIPTPNSSRRSSMAKEEIEDNDDGENDELSIDEEENDLLQKSQRSQTHKSRIPSPFELRQSSPQSRRSINNNSNNEVGSDSSSAFKSKIPGPRSPQRSTAKPRLSQQSDQPENDNIDHSDQQQNQRIPRRVLFDSDENESNKESQKSSKNDISDQYQNKSGGNSKLIDGNENVINNLNLSSNEEPMIHKSANSIPDRHPSLSEEEEAFIRRRMRLPRRVLNQSDESDNYNDAISISSNSFSPQQQLPSPPVVNDFPDKKKAANRLPQMQYYDENENESIVDIFVNQGPKETFIIPEDPEPAAEESLNSAYDFVALTSTLFSKPKKKPHSNQISPLILAFSPPFLEDE